MQNIGKAVEIAKKSLRNCYGKKGIRAGLHHFKDYWARDSCFASYGSLALKDYKIVKKNLNHFLGNLDKSWQLPKRIGNERMITGKARQIPLRVGNSQFGIIMNYLGLNIKKRFPYYTTDKNENNTVDQNSLILISFYEYIKKTGNRKLLKKYINELEKVLLWNYSLDHDVDLMIEEKEYANWTDSLKKKGKVLYTNVCHCHALKCLSELFAMVNMKKQQKKYGKLYRKTKKRINRLFWNGKYYIDWIDDRKKYDYFSTDGNMLAVIWDIASKKKAKSIVKYSEKHGLDDVPSGCVYPEYPDSMVSPMIRFIGLKDYHNGVSWLWLGCVSAIAKHKAGMKKEAVKILEKMSVMITKHGTVYEIYEKDGTPVRRLIYRSEYPFAWSAGVFLYAVKEILRKKTTF